MFEDMVKVQFCNACSINGFIAGDEDMCLGTIVVCDREYHVIAIGFGEFSDKIHSDCVEG